MKYTECQIFKFRFLLLALFLGVSLFTVSSCSGYSKEKHLTRGEEYLQKRKFQEAAMEFRAAADIDKTSAAAHWGLARAYESLGQFDEAIEELRRVAEYDENNLEAKVKLGNYYLLSEPPQSQETERLLADVLTRDPNFIEAHILKASLLAALGKPARDVLNALDNAISLNPNRTETYLSLARYFIKTNRIDEAEKAIQKGISVNANSAVGYLEYGRFLSFADRASEAEMQFQKAIQIESKNIEVREALAEFYVTERKFEKAEQAYKEIVETQGNSLESRMDLANFYQRIGREDDALRIFNGILTEKPEYVRARYRLGEIYLERKDNQKANEQVTELLNINNKDAEALMIRARLSMQQNNAEEAIQDLEEVLKKQPTQKNALFYMTQARLALAQVDQARAFIGDLERYHPNFLKTKLLKIQASFTGEEPENALRGANELLDAVKSSYPNADNDAQGLEELRIRALSARGLAYLQLGKLVEARADLQEVLRLSPNSSSAMVNLAKIAVAENNLIEAQSLYEKALAADVKNFDALSGLIDNLNKQKQFAPAREKIDRVIAESSGQKDVLAALHYLKSGIFMAEKNQPAAESELKTAMETDDEYLPAFSAYASLLAARNQTAEAIEEYKKVVEKKPSASIYTLIGMLEEARNNVWEAEKNYRKALEIAADSPIAANNLAWLIANNQGNLDEALQLAQATVNKNSNVAGYYDTLGWIYYKKGLNLPAVEQLKKAVLLDEMQAQQTNGSTNAGYRLRLGMALASAGDKPSARKEVEISLQNAGSLSEREMREAKIMLASL